MNTASQDSNGRRLLGLLAAGLVLAGLAALGLGLSGRFLPHDEAFLGMTAEQLCKLHGCRVVHFMVHDRVSFGGAVLAVGLVYLWLARGPLHERQAWAWWAVLVSGTAGFASFLAWLGFGYLDAWHAAGTLTLLPCFVLGLACSRGTLAPPSGISSFVQPPLHVRRGRAHSLGRTCLMAASAGLAAGGLTILVLGMTCVFVPEDLAYLGVGVEELHALNPRLVPLIAHDRAGFGGAVCSCGIVLFCCVCYGAPSRRLWLVLALAGLAGFGPAIAIHPAVGYNDPVHLAPAVTGAVLYLLGLVLTFRTMTAAGAPGVVVRSWKASRREDRAGPFQTAVTPNP
jgi:hypothetical protein